MLKQCSAKDNCMSDYYLRIQQYVTPFIAASVVQPHEFE